MREAIAQSLAAMLAGAAVERLDIDHDLQRLLRAAQRAKLPELVDAIATHERSFCDERRRAAGAAWKGAE